MPNGGNSEPGGSSIVRTVEVDGETFVVHRADPRGTHYDWVSGPNADYGFSSSASPERSEEEHRESILAFLRMIDPATGYIGEGAP